MPSWLPLNNHGQFCLHLLLIDAMRSIDQLIGRVPGPIGPFGFIADSFADVDEFVWKVAELSIGTVRKLRALDF